MKNLYKNLAVYGLTLGLALPAFAGPDSGGGGNSSGRNAATHQSIIFNAMATPLVFDFMLEGLKIDTQWNSQSHSVKLFKKFFAHPEDPSATIRKFKVKPQLAPCIHNGEEMDASNNIKTREICFSVERISARKYSVVELVPKLVALYAHELAEVRGMTHDEAREFQFLVETEVKPVNMHQVFEWLGAEAETVEIFEEVANSFAALHEAIKSNKLASVCAASGFLMTSLTDTANSLEKINGSLYTGHFSYILGERNNNRLLESLLRVGIISMQGCDYSPRGNLGVLAKILIDRINSYGKVSMHEAYSEFIAQAMAVEPPPADLEGVEIFDSCFAGGDDCFGQKQIEFSGIRGNTDAEKIQQILFEARLARNAFEVAKGAFYGRMLEAKKIDQETRKVIKELLGYEPTENEVFMY